MHKKQANEVHPQVMRLVAGARDFKDVYSSYENTLMTPNISPSIPARRIYTN